MRKLRVAILTIAGSAPVLAATIFEPACGSDADPVEPHEDAREEVAIDSTSPFGDARLDAPAPPPLECSRGMAYVVDLPEAGALATPEQLCAVQQPTAVTTAARVTFTAYSPGQNDVAGFVAVPPDLEAIVVGTPSLSVTLSRSGPAQSIAVTTMTKVAGGFQFAGTLDATATCNDSIDVAATFVITCTDGGTKTVESRTRLDLCDGADGGLGWVSSGDQCCDCVIIAEMAPSPIVSDKKKDDLPLARVVRLRVLELGRAGRQVLVFAENDAGAELDIEWSVSAGSLERVASDLMIWTLPHENENDGQPFGQVAVWNDAGAAVENFAWGVA